MPIRRSPPRSRPPLTAPLVTRIRINAAQSLLASADTPETTPERERVTQSGAVRVTATGVNRITA